jgi:hypothetical protein
MCFSRAGRGLGRGRRCGHGARVEESENERENVQQKT